MKECYVLRCKDFGIFIIHRFRKMETSKIKEKEETKYSQGKH